MAEERLIIMKGMHDEDIVIEYSFPGNSDAVESKTLTPGNRWTVELVQGRIVARRNEFLHSNAQYTQPVEVFILPPDTFVIIFRQERPSRTTLGAMT